VRRWPLQQLHCAASVTALGPPSAAGKAGRAEEKGVMLARAALLSSGQRPLARCPRRAHASRGSSFVIGAAADWRDHSEVIRLRQPRQFGLMLGTTLSACDRVSSINRRTVRAVQKSGLPAPLVIPVPYYPINKSTILGVATTSSQMRPTRKATDSRRPPWPALLGLVTQLFPEILRSSTRQPLGRGSRGTAR